MGYGNARPEETVVQGEALSRRQLCCDTRTEDMANTIKHATEYKSQAPKSLAALSPLCRSLICSR